MTPRWRFSHLLLAPHRLAFFMAAVMLATSALWWATLLLARAWQWPLSPVVAAPVMHALLMSLGTMPLFFVGFLYTAGPKWLKLPAVSARSLLPALVTLMTGWALACGSGFVVIKLLEFSAKAQAGIDLSTNTFYMFYLLLTGFHFFHVLAAMVFLTILLVKTRAGHYGKHDHHALETGAAFWHMVDLLWIVLFPLIYVMR